MKTVLVKILVIFAIIINVSGAIDYCKLCPNHLACNTPGNFAPKCSANAKLMELTQAQIDLFVKLHNERRNQLAGGLIPGYKSAVNIPEVTWDSELAYFAEFNVKQCLEKHDVKCRRSSKYKVPGQNVWKIIGTSPMWNYTPFDSDIIEAVDGWFNEYSKTNSIGHFNQIIQTRTVAIGCAASRYLEANGIKSELITCNYSSEVFGGVAAYIPGPPASSCKNGKSATYKYLCKSTA